MSNQKKWKDCQEAHITSLGCKANVTTKPAGGRAAVDVHIRLLARGPEGCFHSMHVHALWRMLTELIHNGQYFSCSCGQILSTTLVHEVVLGASQAEKCHRAPKIQCDCTCDLGKQCGHAC